jgi:hypothetical protein
VVAIKGWEIDNESDWAVPNWVRAGWNIPGGKCLLEAVGTKNDPDLGLDVRTWLVELTGLNEDVEEVIGHGEPRQSCATIAFS